MQGPVNSADGRRLLTPTEAARFLGISVKTLANARVSGTSPPFVKAFGVRYRFEDLERFVSAKLRSSTSDRGNANE